MTHQELASLAVAWLKRSHSAKGPGCHLAMKEVGGHSSGERADAWGYRWGSDGGSTLVEVKVSRSDFLADAQKPHRAGDIVGMGTWRYYLCPEGMISVADLPDGWGLLWATPKGRIKLQAGHVCLLNGDYCQPDLVWLWSHRCNQQHELDMLAHLLSRVGDPDQMNERIREAGVAVNRINRQLEEQKSICKTQSEKILKHWENDQYLMKTVDMLVAIHNGQANIDKDLLKELQQRTDAIKAQSVTRQELRSNMRGKIYNV